MKIVALVGRNYVGKSTLALHVANKLNSRSVNAYVLSFADGVREELVAMYNLSAYTFQYTEKGVTECHIIRRYINSHGTLPVYGYKDVLKFSLNSLNLSKAQYGMINELWSDLPITKEENWMDKEITLRELMIYHATDIRRNQDNLYWVKKTAHTIEHLESAYDIVIIDDARFDTEFDYLNESGCTFIEVSNEVALKRIDLFNVKASDKAEQSCIDCISRLGTLRTRVLVDIPIRHRNVEEVFGLIPITKLRWRN